MTNDAQFALRRVIEKYTKNTRFCLICNYVSKIIPALQSRCTRFRFAPLARNQIHGRLLEVADAEKCEYTEDGIESILRLSGGDMRRVLNLLQSTAMSHKVVDQRTVYLTSGAPLPKDMETILEILMNEPFQKGYGSIVELCTTHGYALADVLHDLTVMVSALDLPSEVMARLLSGMSDVEYRLAFGTDEKIQTASLVGVFVQTRELTTVS
jgi:replication factor C subunit 3/5